MFRVGGHTKNITTTHLSCRGPHVLKLSRLSTFCVGGTTTILQPPPSLNFEGGAMKRRRLPTFHVQGRNESVKFAHFHVEGRDGNLSSAHVSFRGATPKLWPPPWFLVGVRNENVTPVHCFVLVGHSDDTATTQLSGRGTAMKT